MTQDWEGGIHHPGQPARERTRGGTEWEGRRRSSSPSAALPLSQARDTLTHKGDSQPREGGNPKKEGEWKEHWGGQIL